MQYLSNYAHLIHFWEFLIDPHPRDSPKIRLKRYLLAEKVVFYAHFLRVHLFPSFTVYIEGENVRYSRIA